MADIPKRTDEEPAGDDSALRAEPTPVAEDEGGARAYPDDDPLAELARLVSEDNPFTKIDLLELGRDRDEGQTGRPPFTSAPEAEPEARSADRVVPAPVAPDTSAPTSGEAAFRRPPERLEPELPPVPELADFAAAASRADESSLAAAAGDDPSKASPAPVVTDFGPNDPGESGDRTREMPVSEVTDRPNESETAFAPLPDIAAADGYPSEARIDTGDMPPRPQTSFEPVLEHPGDPDFASASRGDAAPAETPEPEVSPGEAALADLKRIVGPQTEPAETDVPDNVRPTPPPGMPEEDSGVTERASLSARVDAASAALATTAAAGRSAGGGSAVASQTPAAKAPAADDPFAALEGALQREVDAVLKANAGDGVVGHDPMSREDDEPRQGRSLMIAGSVVGLVILGMAGAFAYRGLVADSTGDADTPVIRASDAPLKERPSDPGGAKVENQDALVFERAAGDTGTDKNVNIVSREETVTAIPAPVKAEDRVEATALGEGSRDKPRIITPAPLNPDGSPNAPRKVRTMIVKPDGTIVRASEDGTEETIAAAPPARAQAANPAAPAPANSVETTAVSQDAEPVVPVEPVPVAAGPEDASIPLPPARPGGVPDRQVAGLAETAPQATPAARAPASAVQAPAPVAASPYLVQISSRRSQQQALSEFASLQSRYPNILGQYQPFIERADLGIRGIYYRLRVGPLGNQASASRLCNQLRSAGLPDCLVRRN